MSIRRLTNYSALKRWRERWSHEVLAGHAVPDVPEINFSGNCSDPVDMLFLPDPDGWEGTLAETLWEMRVLFRCRKCRRCLTVRKWEWFERCRAEIEATKGRIWWGTLTASPNLRLRWRAKAAERKAELAKDGWIAPSKPEAREKWHWDILERSAYQDVQKYLKRLRKKYPAAAFRYLIVTEQSQDQTPHFHLLLFESKAAVNVKWEDLNGQWWSNTKWVLLGDSATCDYKALYALKYMSKTRDAKIRASFRFGKSEKAKTPTIKPEGKDVACRT